MKILVLGSSGQVGAYLVKHLENVGHTVIQFDKERSPLEDLRIPNNPILRKAVDDADFVFYLASDVGGSRYLSKYQHSFDFIQNNTAIMMNTFSILREFNKKFVFASSQMSNMSFSPYGVLKAVGEIYTKSLNGRVVKFWNVYGVEHDMEKAHVITDFILKAKNNGVIDMMTDGEEEREFLYADDCCKALESVMLNYDKFDSDTELCITSFESAKVIDIAKVIASYFNAEVKPSDKKDSVQMNKKNVADRTILNYWKPEVSLRDGILKIIAEMSK